MEKRIVIFKPHEHGIEADKSCVLLFDSDKISVIDVSGSADTASKVYLRIDTISEKFRFVLSGYYGMQKEEQYEKLLKVAAMLETKIWGTKTLETMMASDKFGL